MLPKFLGQSALVVYGRSSFTLVAFLYTLLAPSVVKAESDAPASRPSAEILVSGEITRFSYISLSIQLAFSGDAPTVRFKNCVGGHFYSGVLIGEKMREKRATTIAEGAVYSACHLAFLGGVKRSVAREKSTTMLVHAPRDAEGNRIDDAGMKRYFSAYENFTDGKFPGKYRAEIGENFKPDFFLTFWSQGTQGKPNQQLLACKEPPARDLVFKCDKQGAVSFDDLGFTN